MTSATPIPASSDARALDFLQGGGEMGALIRSIDWQATPLGAPQNWSPALRTMVRILLANRFPLLLWWGPRYIQIYNDPYRPVPGDKHPASMGQPASECWPEIWNVIGPLIDTPFNGGPATWIEDLELILNRAGFFEETHFTVAYSPAPDETAPRGIGGVLATVHEITEKIVGQRRVMVLRDLGAAAEAKSAEEACANAAQSLADHAKDLPFALLYLVDTDGRNAVLAAAAGIEMAPGIAPRSIPLDESGEDSPWPLAAAKRTGKMIVVDRLSSKFDAVPQGPWSDEPHTAVVLPVRSHVGHQFSGFLVAGLSSRLRFDDSYKSFVDLVTSQIATARAYEEERKRAEALAEIDRVKTAFFSNVSHEFRTPLTLMLGPLENLLAKDSLASEDREQIATAHRNSLRLLKLVNSLLDFSRIEAGRIKASFAPADLAAATADLASNFRSAMEAAGLRFTVDCPPLSQPVYVDRDMWEKIVLNLLSNAFKFTFEGSVSVRLAETGNTAVLTVEDTGTGIPEPELPHIFERFHRVEGAKGRTYEGTGIGLALIRELVKLHGGSVTAKSRVGEGSAFSVALPFGSAHLPKERIGVEPAPAATTIRADAFTGEALTWIAGEQLAHPSEDLPPAVLDAGWKADRPRVLLADDNGDMREHVAHILGTQYDVVTVADGRAALEEARRIKPDLVVADIMMPQLDGFGLLQELRAGAGTADIPIVMLSARAGEEARTEGMDAGADDYLVKPFSARELLARVSAHLKLARMRRDLGEQTAHLLESITDGFLALDSNWRFTYINAEAERLNGIKRQELLGRNHWEAFPATVGTTVHRELIRVMDERVSADFENYYAPWDRWFHVKAYPAADRGISVFFEDITERKHAESALQQSEERFRQLAEVGPQIVWLSGPQGELEFVNRRWTEFSGLDLAATKDPEQIGPRLHPEDHLLEHWWKSVAAGTPFELEARLRGKDGEFRWFMMRSIPIKDKHGRVVRWFGTSTDIHRNKLLELELRSANRDLEQFAYSASHDLQEPLRTVNLYSELLGKRYGGKLDGQALEFLDYLRKGASRMEMLVRDLLAYTQTTRSEPPAKPCDASAVLEEALQNLTVAIAEAGASVEFDPLPAVLMQPTQLQQLFQNLIGNAIKYRRPGVPPVVHISARRQNAEWIFSISDNGIGIEPEYKERIFGLFKRLHTGDQYAGTGIGLALCQRIVERHRGRIWVESEPGKGSTFYFTVPA